MDSSTSESSPGSGLAASEYPVSVDALLPILQCDHQHESDVASVLRTESATLRHNAIHRYTLSTRTIAPYCRLEQIGEGTYGQVYRAKCLTPTLAYPEGGEMVALKKIRLHHPGYWGIPPTVIREIKILKKLQHKNLVKMFEVASSKGVEQLDWEDEREDEKRKKEAKMTRSSNSTPLPLVDQDDMDPFMAKSDTKKTTESTKKKKKEAMSDVEKLRESYKGNLFLVLEQSHFFVS